jgi:hypothetical protein
LSTIGSAGRDVATEEPGASVPDGAESSEVGTGKDDEGDTASGDVFADVFDEAGDSMVVSDPAVVATLPTDVVAEGARRRPSGMAIPTASSAPAVVLSRSPMSVVALKGTGTVIAQRRRLTFDPPEQTERMPF